MSVDIRQHRERFAANEREWRFRLAGIRREGRLSGSTPRPPAPRLAGDPRRILAAPAPSRVPAHELDELDRVVSF
jgi:hypothetical protein